LTFILTFSCGQNSAEKKLNGKWYEIENEYATWEFYPDSLIVGTEDKYKVEWRATASKIEFDYPTYYWDSLGKIVNIIDKIVIDYELSSNNDTLNGILTNRNGKHEFGLIKTE
jgi:hypothetical protein